MNFQIPVQHLFTVTLEGLESHSYAYQGPSGARRFEKAVGGTVRGGEMNGKVLELLATDYGRVSQDGSIRSYNASVTLEGNDGTVILMQYRGRSSPRYGAGQSRVQVLFQAPDGPLRWLNGVQCIGYGEQRGDSTVFEIYALTCEAGYDGPDDTRPPTERTTVPGEFLFMRRSEHVPGAARNIIHAPLGTRYLTLAEGGGKFSGPRLSGDFVSGFSWGPHRMLTEEDGTLLLQYDMETFLTSDDGAPILMLYTGATSARYPKGFWMTAVSFEAELGPHGWLNEVQAVGFGRRLTDGNEYDVYALI